jgi:hypothetical protein
VLHLATLAELDEAGLDRGQTVAVDRHVGSYSANGFAKTVDALAEAAEIVVDPLDGTDYEIVRFDCHEVHDSM